MLGRVGQESTHGEVEHQLTHAEVLADENMVKQHGLKVASSQLQVIPDALCRDYTDWLKQFSTHCPNSWYLHDMPKESVMKS